MAELKFKIKVELEQLDKLLAEMPDVSSLSGLSVLELAGVATLLHNFYNGLENILKQILKSRSVKLKNSSAWHKELLNAAENQEIITGTLKNQLGEYLAFRHFFSHGYALDLYPQKMEPLVRNIKSAYNQFQKEIQDYVN